MLIAGGRDKGIDLTALAPVVAERAAAAVLIGESGPTLEAAFRAAGLARDGTRGRPRRGRRRADALAREALAEAAGRAAGRRPSCSARPRPASTCSSTTRPADGRSRRPWRHSPRPAAREGADEPRATDPAASSDRDASPSRSAADVGRPPTGRRSRAVPARSAGERHQADYVILVVVVALTAIGILMVYSSSALRGYLSQDADTFATVGPQIQWALLGLVAMVVMMRVDYRYLRLASVPFYVVALVPARARVRARSSTSSSAARRAGSSSGRCRPIHPAEIAKLALVVYLAHWFAKRGTRIHGFWGGTVPFLIIVAPVVVLVFKEPDLGTTRVITLTAFTMFFVAGANLFHLGGHGRRRRPGRCSSVGLRGYQLDRIRAWQNPWLDRARRRLPHGPGPARAGARRAVRDRPRGEPRVRPERLQRLHLRRGRPGVRVHRGDRRHRPVRRCWRTRASASRWPRRTRSGRCWRPGSPPGCASRRSSTSAVVVTLLPITGITLPFVSAGGSSLIISFAAVGILLSISRETVEKGTWNDDATADRGRRDGRTHLPGARRRPVAARRARTAPELPGSAAIAASRRRLVPAAGIPLRRLAAALAAHDRRERPRRPRSAPPGRVGAAGGRDPRPRAAGGDLHDRRLRRRPGPDGRGAAAASRSCMWDGNVIPGRASARRPAWPTPLAVSFDGDLRRARAAAPRTPVLRHRARRSATSRGDRPRGGPERLGIPDRASGSCSSSAARRPSAGSTPPWPRRCRGWSSA